MEKLTYPIFIIGMPGTGKSTIGKSLAEKLKVEILDLDAYIESELKMTIQTLFEEKGEHFFREIESFYLDKFKRFQGIVSTGGGIVLDKNNQNILKEGFTIFIDTPLDILKSRMLHDDKRPLLKMHSLDNLYQVRYPLYKACSKVTFKNQQSLETIISAIIAYVEA